MSLGTKGAVAGALYVRAKQESASHDDALTELQMLDFKATRKLIHRRSAKEALGELMQEVLDERRGRKPVRLSDPKNSELRNDEFVEIFAKIVAEAAEYVRVPRGMTLLISDEEKQEFKALRSLK